MRISNRITKAVLSLILFTSIIHTENSTNSSTAIPQAQIELIENVLQQVYTGIAKIDQICGQLAMLVSSNQIKNIPNKDFAIGCLRDIRVIIGATLRDQAVVNSIKDPSLQAQIVIALVSLCDALERYIGNAIKTNLKDLKPFDITPLTKRSFPTNITQKQLVTSVSMIQSRIEQLEKQTETVGLTWYNRATRTLEYYVVDPCNKYHIPTATLIGASTLFLSAWILWHFGHQYAGHDDNGNLINTPKWLPRPLGNAIDKIVDTIGVPMKQSVTNPYGFDDYDADKHGFASIADKAFVQLLTPSYFPHISLVGGLTLGAYMSTWRDTVKPWITKKGITAWNFMRGGAYEQKNINGVWDFEPKVNFDDLVGLDEVKEAFSFIVEFLDNPEQYLRIHAAPETGWLLTGPTRTGKSFSVECLCGQIARMLKKRNRNGEFKFWKVDAALINQYGITDILETAKANAPIVLFIDEIDLLGLQRVGNNQLLSQFLTSMQSTMDTNPSKQVIIIAATNKPETLDKALRQNGRLGKEIRFEYPSFKYRKKYLTQELNNMALDLSTFDLDSLAFKTEGKSFEDLRALIRTAMVRAWMRGYPLSQALLEESLDTEIRHIIMTDRKDLPENEKRVLAAYFAGQALAFTLLDTNAKLDKVTIKAVMTDLKEETQWDEYLQKDEKEKQQKIKYGAIFTKFLSDTIKLSSYDQNINEIKILLAGFAAEEILFSSSSFKCHPENSNFAYRLIESMVFGGLDPQRLSKNVYKELSDKTYSLFVQYKQEITQLLRQHKDKLELLADALINQSTLTDTQVHAVINGETQPETADVPTDLIPADEPQIAPAAEA